MNQSKRNPKQNCQPIRCQLRVWEYKLKIAHDRLRVSHTPSLKYNSINQREWLEALILATFEHKALNIQERTCCPLTTRPNREGPQTQSLHRMQHGSVSELGELRNCPTYIYPSTNTTNTKCVNEGF
jgi:hypothetical protein